MRATSHAQAACAISLIWLDIIGTRKNITLAR